RTLERQKQGKPRQSGQPHDKLATILQPIAVCLLRDSGDVLEFHRLLNFRSPLALALVIFARLPVLDDPLCLSVAFSFRFHRPTSTIQSRRCHRAFSPERGETFLTLLRFGKRRVRPSFAA